MMTMAETATFADRHRSGLLSLVMLAVLLVSVGAAQWLVRCYGAAARRGADILAKVRTNKLDTYWKDDTSRQWYLIEDHNGKAMGYRTVAQRKTRDGYAGASRLVLRTESHVEHWQLSPDAAKGRYQAISHMPTGDLDRTDILLQDGLVTVTKAALDAIGEASYPAPDNYAPEGLLSLLIAETIKSGQKAAFSLVDNEQAIVEGKVFFSRVTVTPQGPRQARVECARLGDTSELVYRLDDQGRIVAREYGEGAMAEKLVTLRQLTKAFPHLADQQEEPGDTQGDQDDAPPSDDGGSQEEPAADPGLSA